MHTMALKALPVSLSSLVVLISTSIPLAGAADTVDDSRCNCYISNNSDLTYYSNHKFYDFRSLSEYAGIPGLLQNPYEASTAGNTSDYFKSETWNSFWETQAWNSSDSMGATTNASTVMRIFTPNNVYIEGNTDSGASPQTWLSLRTARQPMFQSAAEIATKLGDLQFLSMRMLARTVGAPGGCTAMFTYREGSVVQEADLEVLTKYSRDQVQCTNQPAIDGAGQLISNATRQVTLPAGVTWDNWAVYRLDWTPKQSIWYVNGQQIANIAFQVPRDGSKIHINAWSDGGNWTGTMGYKTEAHLQIQWWEVLYNRTSQRPDGDCKAVCSIDASSVTGRAVMISNSLAAGRLLDQRGGLGFVSWVPSVAMLVMMLLSLSALPF